MSQKATIVSYFKDILFVYLNDLGFAIKKKQRAKGDYCVQVSINSCGPIFSFDLFNSLGTQMYPRVTELSIG